MSINLGSPSHHDHLMAYWSEDTDRHGMKTWLSRRSSSARPWASPPEPDRTAGIVGMIATIMILLSSASSGPGHHPGLALRLGPAFIWFTLREYQRNRILTFLDQQGSWAPGTTLRRKTPARACGQGPSPGASSSPSCPSTTLTSSFPWWPRMVVEDHLPPPALHLLITKIIQVSERTESGSTDSSYGIAGYFSLHIFINISMTMGIFPAGRRRPLLLLRRFRSCS